MGVPYEIKPVGLVAVPGGQSKTVLVDFPARSFISKIVVVQRDGAVDDFTVELFNHADALEGTEASASDASGEKVPLDCYRVCSPLVGTGGRLLYFSDEATGGHGLLFFCQDTDPDRRGQVKRNLYLRITPAGAGNKTFAFCIGGESQIAGA